jgi:hypothetical protein
MQSIAHGTIPPDSPPNIGSPTYCCSTFTPSAVMFADVHARHPGLGPRPDCRDVPHQQELSTGLRVGALAPHAC